MLSKADGGAQAVRVETQADSLLLQSQAPAESHAKEVPSDTTRVSQSPSIRQNRSLKHGMCTTKKIGKKTSFKAGMSEGDVMFCAEDVYGEDLYGEGEKENCIF